MMEVLTLSIRKTSTMFHGTFAAPDLSAFCLLDEHGLTVTGQQIDPDKAVLECRVTDRDPFCRGCGAEGIARGTQARRLAHVPLGWRPTTLLVRVRRFACSGCGTIWREDTTAAAEPRGNSLASRSDGPWKLSSASTCPSRGSRSPSTCPGMPPTTPCSSRAGAS